jgi:hypothetical protein
MNLGVDPDEIYLLTGFMKDGILDIDLPNDPEVRFQAKIEDSKLTSSGISTSTPPTRLGPFCRTAEASQLLGKVLEFITSSSLHKSENSDQDSRFLDSELQKLAMALLQEAINGWEQCCAAIGICFRSD